VRVPTPSSWQGLVAVIVALGVTAGIVLLSVNELTTQGHLNQEAATLLATVLGAAIGAVATFLGMRDSEPKSPDQSEPPN
jgi:uncharacterized membrane protein YccC